MSTVRRDNGIPATAPDPLDFPIERIVLLGVAGWAVALVVTVVVPALHTGDRSWWPWTAVAGIVLGGLGYLYVRAGRGNASDAHPHPADPQATY